MWCTMDKEKTPDYLALCGDEALSQDSTRSPGTSSHDLGPVIHTLNSKTSLMNMNDGVLWSSIVAKEATCNNGADGAPSWPNLAPEYRLPADKVTFRKVGYTLDKTKALKKKLNAAQRQYSYTIEKADKNNITISCQAGLYELFRRATCIYYMHMDETSVNMNAIIYHDRERNVVQNSYKITGKSGTNKKEYTISLYHTTSTIMANGKNYSRFLDTDWQQIATIIHEINEINRLTDCETLNNTIQGCLLEVLQMSKNKKPTKTKERTSHRETLEVLNTPCSTANSHDKEESTSTSLLMIEAEQTTTKVNNNLAQPTSSELQEREHIQDSLAFPAIGIQDHTQNPPTNLDLNSLEIKGPANPTQATTHCHTSEEKTLGNTSPIEPSPCKTLLIEPPSRKKAHRAPNSEDCIQGNVSTILSEPNVPMNLGAPGEGLQNMEEATRAPTHVYNEQQNYDYNCANCRILRADWHRSLQDTQTREKKLAAAEKSLKSRERDMERHLAQLESQKAVILSLEARITDLTASNRLLTQALEASSAGQSHHGETWRTNNPRRSPRPSNTDSQVPDPGCNHITLPADDLKEEVRTLREELRLRDMEFRLTERINNVEKTILTSKLPAYPAFPTSAQNQPHLQHPPWMPPYMWIPHTPHIPHFTSMTHPRSQPPPPPGSHSTDRQTPTHTTYSNRERGRRPTESTSASTEPKRFKEATRPNDPADPIDTGAHRPRDHGPGRTTARPQEQLWGTQNFTKYGHRQDSSNRNWRERGNNDYCGEYTPTEGSPHSSVLSTNHHTQRRQNSE